MKKKKAGRKKKDSKTQETLQIKRDNITLTFDSNIKGDLKDIMMKIKNQPEIEEQQDQQEA
jgi:hypothetical protein